MGQVMCLGADNKLKAGEMRLLNIRLKLQLDTTVEKSPIEASLAKFMTNPNFKVYVVGIEGNKERFNCTFAIFKENKEDHGLDAKFIETTSAEDGTHFQFKSKYTAYDDLSIAAKTEAEMIYAQLSNQKDNDVVEEEQHPHPE